MGLRRRLLRALGSGAFLTAPAWLLQPPARAAKAHAVTRTDGHWKALLTPGQYAVRARQHARHVKCRNVMPPFRANASP
jgi:hypothetical protein